MKIVLRRIPYRKDLEPVTTERWVPSELNMADDATVDALCSKLASFLYRTTLLNREGS